MRPSGELGGIAAAFWPRRHGRLRWRLVQTGAAALLLSALLLYLTSSSTARHMSALSVSPTVGQSSQRRLLLEAAVINKSVNSNLSERQLQLSRKYWAKVQLHFSNGGSDSPHYRMLESRCSVPDNETEPIQALQLPPTGFSDHPYLINSGPCTGRVSIVLAVHSAVGHSDRRRVIRETWGSVRYVRGRRLLLVFFLGRPAGDAEQRQQAAVAEEAARHQDIVQRDFVDSYRNMTIKHLGIYDWLFEFCKSADWLVKVDDDVFVDVFHLEAFLSTYRPDAGLCCKVQSGRPERVPSDKWFVTRREFPGDKYPKYCEGYAYIIKPTLARLLYWCSVFSRRLWIDDVYVLGILVQRLGLRHQPALQGHLWADLLPSHMGKAIVDNVFLVDRHNGLQASTWRRLHRAAVKYSY